MPSNVIATGSSGASASETAGPASAVVTSMLGAVNAVVVFGLGWALWFVFLHPNGILKLYTPMYGFSLIAVLVAVLVAMARAAEGRPLRASSLSRPVRGALLALVAFVLTGLVVYGFFWAFLGRFGVTYFSPRAIVAAGGVGAEFFNARENASTAIVYLTTAFLWVSVATSAGFGNWPWQDASPGVRAFSRLSVVSLISVVAYAVLFHPHVTQLFYPAQTFAGVPPWWAAFAQTGSAYFNLGWVLMTVAVLVYSEVLWDGWPWRPAQHAGGPVRGTIAVVISAAVGIGLFALALRAMNAFWGEAFQGGQYTDAPYFRALHAGELAGFLVLSAYALDTYFTRPRTAAQRVLWTVAAVAGAALLHVYYYSGAATRMLGKVPGMAQPEDTPLVWTLLLLALVLIQRDLFAGWPLRRRSVSA